MSVADAITVMRAGRVVATTTPARDRQGAARAMDGRRGRRAGADRCAPRAAAAPPLFAARGLVARDALGVQRLGPIDLDIFAGEIVGVAGVGGNGQDELVACARRARGRSRRERSRFAGTPTDAARRPARFRAAGIGYVSADRAEEGLCLTASIRDNFVAGRESERRSRARGLLRRSASAERAQAALAALSVRYGRLTDAAATCPAATSSASSSRANSTARRSCWSPRSRRAASTSPASPSSTRRSPRSAIAAARCCWSRRTLDEMLALSDRIVALYSGRFVGELARAQASVESVGRMMLGPEGGMNGALTRRSARRRRPFAFALAHRRRRARRDGLQAASTSIA